MKASSVFFLFEELKDDKMSFLYHGNFSNKVLGMATSLVKKHVDSDEKQSNLRNKLSFLMIECFQNIVRYGNSEHETESDSALVREMFLTRNTDDSFYIITSNLIENDKIGYVKSKLEEVNNLPTDELKKLYVKILTNNRLSNQGGAGLGFIEMVRKTKERLDFDFVPVDDEVSFFYFQLWLKGNKIQKEAKPIPISASKRIHEIISRENILLVHKGNFTQKALRPVLTVVEDNMNDLTLAKQKRIFHIIVEILQNISKHSYKQDQQKQGIIVICKEENEYIFGAGNFIQKDRADFLKKYLDFLVSLNLDELNNYYKKVLREGPDNDDFSSGLGLIDIARESYKKLDYEFYEYDDDLIFYSIIAKI